MYLELQQYSNKLMKVFSGKDRLIFQFKHPRLYHKQASGVFDLNNYIGGASNTSITQQTNFLTNSSSITSVSMVPDKDVVEMHSLVFSKKTQFGRIYVLDSSGNAIKFHVYDKNLSSGKYLHEVIRFFGQFNHYVYQLAAAALLPMEMMSPDTVTSFIQTLSGGPNSWYQSPEIHGYAMSFCYPVLKEIKFYLYPESAFGGISTESQSPNGIKAAYYYNSIKRAKTFSEFIKSYTGINGSAFVKKVAELSKGEKRWHLTSVEGTPSASSLTDEQKKHLTFLAQSQPFEYVKQHAGYTTQLDVAVRVLFGDPSIDDFNGGFFTGSYKRAFPEPYKTETFYHFGFFKYWDLFKDKVPLDFWFELDYIPKDVFDADFMNKDIWDQMFNMISELPQPGVKKIFQSYSKLYLRDAAQQYYTYKNIDDVPEKARELFPNGLQLPKKWKTTKELHDLISKDYNTIKQLSKWRRVKYDESTQKLDQIDFGDGWTSELPKDTVRITEYGAKLKHCVASYADRCAIDNRTVILSINKDGTPVFTLELEQTLNDIENKRVAYKIRQFKGFQNKVPKSEAVREIINKLYTTEMINGVMEPYGWSYTPNGPNNTEELDGFAKMAITANPPPTQTPTQTPIDGGAVYVDGAPLNIGEVGRVEGQLVMNDGVGYVNVADLNVSSIVGGRVDFNPNLGYNQQNTNPLEGLNAQALQEAIRAGTGNR